MDSRRFLRAGRFAQRKQQFEEGQIQQLLHLQSAYPQHFQDESAGTFVGALQDPGTMARFAEVFFSHDCSQLISKEVNLPDPWSWKVPRFQLLQLVKVLRPDLFVRGVQRFIEQEVGRFFVEVPPLALEEQFHNNSSHLQPILLINQPGTDPLEQVQKLFESVSAEKQQIRILSLGQGSIDQAEATILEAVGSGSWVVLQNCHFSQQILEILKRLYDNFSNLQVDRKFRLWLTTYSIPNFPSSVLQNSLKIRYEDPQGIKYQIRRNYQATIKLDKQLQSFQTKHGAKWQRVFFGLSYFHALINERKKFGHLGWNQPYEFS